MWFGGGPAGCEANAGDPKIVRKMCPRQKETEKKGTHGSKALVRVVTVPVPSVLPLERLRRILGRRVLRALLPPSPSSPTATGAGILPVGDVDGVGVGIIRVLVLRCVHVGKVCLALAALAIHAKRAEEEDEPDNWRRGGRGGVICGYVKEIQNGGEEGRRARNVPRQTAMAMRAPVEIRQRSKPLLSYVVGCWDAERRGTGCKHNWAGTLR